jgi:molybdate transport system regulatory protein
MSDLRLTLRIDFGPAGAIGPGKIRLLEAIQKTGSISQAGRSLRMSYRRAWLLVDDLNRCFREPVVTTQPGGSHGGGAALTPFGRELIKKYRAIETQATGAAKRQLRDLESALRARGRPPQSRLKTSIQATTRGDD